MTVSLLIFRADALPLFHYSCIVTERRLPFRWSGKHSILCKGFQ